MRGNLVARLEGLLDGGSLVVDATIESSGPEEGGLGAALVEDVNQLRGVLARTIVVGQSQHAGVGALGDHDTRRWRSTDDIDGILDGTSEGAGDQQAGEKNSLLKHRVGLRTAAAVYTFRFVSCEDNGSQAVCPRQASRAGQSLFMPIHLEARVRDQLALYAIRNRFSKIVTTLLAPQRHLGPGENRKRRQLLVYADHFTVSHATNVRETQWGAIGQSVVREARFRIVRLRRRL